MPRGGEAAARIRAAHGYSDLRREDLGAAIGLSLRHLGRLEAGQATADRELRERIANACGVPPAFMEVGFAPLTDPITDADRRIYLIEQKIAEIAASVQPERLVEIFRPVLAAAGQGERRAQSKPPTARRAKGRRPTGGGDAGA